MNDTTTLAASSKLTRSAKTNMRKKISAMLTMTAMAIILLLGSTIVVAANAPLQQPAYADDGIDFKKIKNLSDNDGTSEQPGIAVARSGDNVYVVWQDETPGNFDIFFRKSTDGGKTFDDTENLSNSDEDSTNPAIAASGRNVYVVWEEATVEFGEPPRDIFFRKSTDRGDDFGKTKDLSDNNGDSNNPAIAAAGKKVYVVWADFTEEEFTSDRSDILFRKSTDRGDDFGRQKDLSDTEQGSFDPVIATSGRNVYVTWAEFRPGQDFADITDILFKRSTDRGHDFGKAKDLSDSDEDSNNPAIATSGRNVYVVWEELTPELDGPSEIFFRKSTDRGDDFGKTKDLSDNDGGSFNPQIATSGRNVYVVWADDTEEEFISDRSDILFRKSTDRGDDFGRQKDLSDTPLVDSEEPAIAAAGKKVYVVWQEDVAEEDANGETFDIFFRRGTR